VAQTQLLFLTVMTSQTKNYSLKTLNRSFFLCLNFKTVKRYYKLKLDLKANTYYTVLLWFDRKALKNQIL
jgi:hypothetical protein